MNNPNKIAVHQQFIKYKSFCFWVSKHILNQFWWKAKQAHFGQGYFHRHLSNINCFTVHTACRVCFISTVNGRSKKERKEANKTCTNSGHMTNLKQSILETFDIYGYSCKIRHQNFTCKWANWLWTLLSQASILCWKILDKTLSPSNYYYLDNKVSSQNG